MTTLFPILIGCKKNFQKFFRIIFKNIFPLSCNNDAVSRLIKQPHPEGEFERTALSKIDSNLVLDVNETTWFEIKEIEVILINFKTM